MTREAYETSGALRLCNLKLILIWEIVLNASGRCGDFHPSSVIIMFSLGTTLPLCAELDELSHTGQVPLAICANVEQDEPVTLYCDCQCRRLDMIHFILPPLGALSLTGEAFHPTSRLGNVDDLTYHP